MATYTVKPGDDLSKTADVSVEDPYQDLYVNNLTRDRTNVSRTAIVIQNSTNALSGLQSLYSETLGDLVFASLF